MTSWGDFAGAAPALADLCRTRLVGPGVVMVGTIRRDGSPRVSPVEPMFLDGELLLGMMWRSAKAVDLNRDPRCVVHSAVTDRHGTDGDIKVRGRVWAVLVAGERSAYADAVEAEIGWRPSDPFHLWRLDVEHVARIIVEGEQMVIATWSPSAGYQRRLRDG